MIPIEQKAELRNSPKSYMLVLCILKEFLTNERNSCCGVNQGTCNGKKARFAGHEKENYSLHLEEDL